MSHPTPPDASSPDEPSPAKPILRGVLHHSAAFFAAGAGAVLVAISPNLRTAAAVAIFSLSLVTLFAVSAIYHRVHWKTERARAYMRRADHASIFVLIAGTYTPVALLGLGGEDGRRLLVMIWAAGRPRACSCRSSGSRRRRHSPRRWPWPWAG